MWKNNFSESSVKFCLLECVICGIELAVFAICNVFGDVCEKHNFFRYA